MAIDMDKQYAPTGRWYVTPVWDSNYDAHVYAVIDPEGYIEDWYDPHSRLYAEDYVDGQNDDLDGNCHNKPNCPTHWMVEMVRTDGEGTQQNPTRLVFVWGYAAALLGDDRESIAILRKLHDHKGQLTATWSEDPSEADRVAIETAWWHAGHESTDTVEHVVKYEKP
jgi:hypothetical protein